MCSLVVIKRSKVRIKLDIQFRAALCLLIKLNQQEQLQCMSMHISLL